MKFAELRGFKPMSPFNIKYSLLSNWDEGD